MSALRKPTLLEELQALPEHVVGEVLSPSTTRADRTKKLPIYARESVSFAWLVDPLARTLEVLRLESQRWVIVGAYAEDAVVRAEPFDAVELPLASLWG